MIDRSDEHYMRLALKEARKGMGRTSPNPCVGAVIVKEGRVVSKGYHKKAGTPHAEVHAIRNALEPVVGGTIYVTLEPCSHTGKTPPCSHAIVEARLARVVIGMTDPNPVVNGNGIEHLTSHFVEVSSGVLEKECEEINYPFIKHITQGLPWVIMKAGVSLDGRLNYQRGQSGWITGEQSLREVHKLRNSVDAILVGRKTVEIDNPSLTTRLPRVKTKDPVRIILDSNLSCSPDSKVNHLDSHAPTWIFCGKNVAEQKMTQFRELGITVFPVERDEFGLNLRAVLNILGGEGVCSLLVEGGARLHSAFIRQQLFDYAHLFYGPVFAGDDGVSLIEGYPVQDRSSAPRLGPVTHKKLGDDILISGKLLYPE
jgi:diaminohydroxyphosphoribosylaminopyrimidine deaminase/5-amino-6-(5-phosphoribosylamino)uracil reductase